MEQKRYWKADRHKWGPGQIHIIDENGRRTLCGRLLAETPGQYIPAIEYDCRACAKAFEGREERIQRQREWQERQRRYDAERAAADQAWWNRYNAYLRSPEWQRRRAAVLKRADGKCEACGTDGATQVHHLTYKHVGNEPLWELRAICPECHEKLTEEDRRQRRISGMLSGEGAA